MTSDYIRLTKMVSIPPKGAAIRSEHSSPAHRLLLAARSGQVEEVSAVLSDAPPSLVARDALTQSGRTLLHVAAHHGHLGVVLAAVTQDAGLDVNVANKVCSHLPYVCVRVTERASGRVVRRLVVCCVCACTRLRPPAHHELSCAQHWW